MKATLAPLAGAALVFLASQALGTSLLRRLDLAMTRSERRLFAFLTGAACLSVVVLVLAAMQLAYASVFCLVAAVLAWNAWIRKSDENFENVPPGKDTFALLALIIAVPFLVLYFFNAWAPEFSPDGSSYHLGNVARFLRNHGLVPIRDLYGALPEGIEMLYLAAFSIGRHSAAALVHCTFLIALPLLMCRYALRFGFPRAGVLAALLVFVSPVFGLDGVSAYNDVALTTVLFGAFFLLELWLEKKCDRFLIPAGLLAGFAFSIKYTGFVAAVYGFLVLGVGLWRERRWRGRPVVMFSAAAIALVMPWIIKDAVYMHNPLSPFLNRLFPNPWISPFFEAGYSESLATSAGTKNPLELAIMYAVTGPAARGVAGLLGPVFLLMPLGLASLRLKHGRHLLLAAVLFALPVLANQSTRFVMAAAPEAALAFALAVSDTPLVTPALIAIAAFSSWPSVVKTYSDQYAWRLSEKIPFAAAWHRRRADDYLHQKLGFWYDMAKIVNAKTPVGSRIFCFHCPPQAYMERDSLESYQSTLGTALFDMLLTPNVPQRQNARLLTLSFASTRVSRLRVMAPRLGPRELWRVHELRVFNAGTEVPRMPAWHIDAWPDPWEAPFAFDNNPVTRWSSEQAGANGAYLEIDFGKPVLLDSVQLECDAGETEGLAVLGGEADRMPSLPVSVKASEMIPPPGLRRDAIDMLKKYGFDYIVIGRDDPFATDYTLRADEYGIRPVARAADITLFRLQ